MIYVGVLGQLINKYHVCNTFSCHSVFSTVANDKSSCVEKKIQFQFENLHKSLKAVNY